MAIKIELNRQALEQALDLKLASLKRALNGNLNPMIKEIYQKEISELQTAKNTMVETTK